MSTYYCPPFWTNAIWLEQRASMLKILQNNDLIVSFRDCTWMDLHPLCDLLVQLGRHLRSGKRVTLDLTIDSEPQARVFRFLIESGFLSCLDKVSDQKPIVRISGKDTTIQRIISDQRTLQLPPKALDYDTLLPCQLLDATQLTSRDDVYELCNRLREDTISNDRARAFRMPVPLIYQTRLFFNTVLPELVDNIRLHKMGAATESTLYTLYARIRRQIDPLRLRSLPGEIRTRSGPLEAATKRFWQHDVFEAAMSDEGPGVLESWMIRWKERNHHGRIPRFPGPPRFRLDGDNADGHILKAVFTSNASSLPEEERRAHALPAVTGLNSIRQTIRVADCGLGVRSGSNYIAIVSGPARADSEDEYEVVVKSMTRFEYSPGVQVFFRCAATRGPNLHSWINGIPRGGLKNAADWWGNAYPERFNQAHVIDDHILPTSVRAGDIVICRAHQLSAKTRLLNFLQDAYAKKVNVIFYELPSPVALRIQAYLDVLAQDLPAMLILVITDSFRIIAIGTPYSRDAARSFAQGRRGHEAYWWLTPSSPIRNLRELFARIRQYDSAEFWRAVDKIPGAFLAKAIQWSPRSILTGGFLAFDVAIRSRPIRRLLQRNLVTLAQLLEVKDVIAADERMRFWAKEIQRSARLETGDRLERIGLLTTIRVGGSILSTSRRSIGRGKATVDIPVLIYPRALLQAGDAAADGDIDQVRIFDWIPETPVKLELDNAGSVIVPYRRSGKMGEIRQSERIANPLLSAKTLTEAALAWQRHELVRFGHFSYLRHHYLVWVDLLKFLADASGDCQEMLISISRAIEEWSPQWIFFSPHEVSYVLLERLRQQSEKLDNKTANLLKDNIWPTSELSLFDTVYGAGIRQLASRPSAVILDDALVTGSTIREVSRRLNLIGFQPVHSMVILDRIDPSTALYESLSAGNQHKSWWSLYVLPVGDNRDCKLCAGLERIQGLYSHLANPVLSDVLDEIMRPWAQRDYLDRFTSSLQEHGAEHQVLAGDARDLRLRSSAVSDAYRLHYASPEFGLPETRPLGDKLSTEVMASLVLHGLDDREDDERVLIIENLVKTLWAEDRSAARGLGMIALASLDRTDIETAQKAIHKEIRQSGISNIEIAAMAYATSLFSSFSPEGAKEVLEQGMDWQAEPDEPTRIRLRDAKDLLRIFIGSDLSRSYDEQALVALGIPGRTPIHNLFLYLVDDLRDNLHLYRSKLDKRKELLVILDIIRRGAEVQKVSCQAHGVWNELSKLFGEWQGIRSSDGTKIPSESLFDRTHRFFWTRIEGKPNLRQILASQLAHYMPYFTREVVGHLTNASDKPIVDSDYLITEEILPIEKRLLDGSFTSTTEQMDMLDLLRGASDIVIADYQVLKHMFMSLLSDVKHPKNARLGIEGGEKPPYMKVTFNVRHNSVDGYPEYLVRLSNRVTADFAESPSFRTIEDQAREINCRASSRRDKRTGFLIRELAFQRIISKRKVRL